MEKGGVKILVLGDSVLSSLGGCFPNALEYFQMRCAYSMPVEFVNPSAVGTTAADALVQLKDLNRSDRFDAVVVYLGNCDACGFGYIKPRIPVIGGGMTTRMKNFIYKKKTPLARRTMPFTFTRRRPSGTEIRQCVTPEAYRSFIRDIIARAHRMGARVILVKPISKGDFPPCNNLGNILFYKIMNIRDRHRFLRGGADQDLIDALDLQNSGRLDEALARYDETAVREEGNEQAIIARNNIAAIHFEKGEHGTALDILDAIPPRGNPLFPVILFNKAVILRSLGEARKSAALFAEARERDRGTYRVTDSYHRALENIERISTSGIHIIDMKRILSNGDFIDYCHPTEKGQEKLFDSLKEAIESALGLRPGLHRPRIWYLPLNPDRYAGFKRSFFEHFGIVTGADSRFVETILAEARRRSYTDLLGHPLQSGGDPSGTGMLRILRHPLFGDADFLVQSPPSEAVDQGKLPELYGIRHMLGVYRKSTVDRSSGGFLEGTKVLIPRSERIAVWWYALEKHAPVPNDERIANIYNHLDPAHILDRAVELLEHTTAREPIAFEKCRTITYWFFRESLIFGTTSHWTMFIDRMSLRDIVDSCLFVMHHEGVESKTGQRFVRVLRAVETLLVIHRDFLSTTAHELYAVEDDWLDRYRSRLRETAASPEFEKLRSPGSRI